MVLTLPTEAQGECGQSLRVGLGPGGHINTRSTNQPLDPSLATGVAPGSTRASNP